MLCEERSLHVFEFPSSRSPSRPTFSEGVRTDSAKNPSSSLSTHSVTDLDTILLLTKVDVPLDEGFLDLQNQAQSHPPLQCEFLDDSFKMIHNQNHSHTRKNEDPARKIII